MSDLPNFDPNNPEFLADPLATYAWLRQDRPVQKLAVSGGLWLLTRYEDIQPLITSPAGRMQPVGMDRSRIFGDAQAPAGRIYRNLMVLNDPPRHLRLRSLAQQALTPHAVENLRDRIEQVVDEALDAVVDQGEMDAVGDLAFVVPYRVICGMLGIPADQREALMAHTPDFFRIFLPEANDAAGIEACNRACEFFIDYLSEIIEARGADGGDDILGGLIRAEAEGKAYERDEIVATALSILAGGFDTTMGMIGAGIYLFARQPEEFDKLRGAPQTGARNAVEEAIRWESPVGVNYRIFPEDMEIADQTIPAGEPVWMALLSANHDQARFEAPDHMRIDRSDNAHLAFGGSRHFCIGQHLAKLEGEIVFRKLAERFTGFELSGPSPRRENFQFRSFESLPVRFEVAA